MSRITEADVERIAGLARVALTKEEVTQFTSELEHVVAYVALIDTLVGTEAPPKVEGALYNVMREDTEPHEPGIYTEALLNEAPARQGNFVVVKKILGDT